MVIYGYVNLVIGQYCKVNLVINQYCKVSGVGGQAGPGCSIAPLSGFLVKVTESANLLIGGGGFESSIARHSFLQFLATYPSATR